MIGNTAPTRAMQLGMFVLRKIWTHLDLLSIPQSGGEHLKTLRWHHRLQRQNPFMAFNRVRSPMVVTLGQQYQVGQKPTAILYTTYINRHAGAPNKTKTKTNDTSSLDYSCSLCYCTLSLGSDRCQHYYIFDILLAIKQVTSID